MKYSFDKYYISNHKMMDNISKTKNEKREFNYCSLSDINKFADKIIQIIHKFIKCNQKIL